jgi:hypothetical protein
MNKSNWSVLVEDEADEESERVLGEERAGLVVAGDWPVLLSPSCRS